MRNFDKEVKELEQDIKNLELTKKEKKTQLESIKKEQRETQEAQQESIPGFDCTAKDFYGKPILVGNWVNVTRKGKFNGTEGIVIKIKKWVTFEDKEGVKQCRAPCNLIVSNLPASCHDGNWNTSGSPKRERP